MNRQSFSNHVPSPHTVTHTSASPFDVLASASPFDVLASASPFVFLASASPFVVLASASPFVVLASASPFVVLASASPFVVLASASPFVFLASASPFDVLASASPFDVLASASPFVVLASASPFVVLASASPFVVLASASPFDVLASASPSLSSPLPLPSMSSPLPLLRCPRLCLSLRCPRLCLSLRCPRLCLSLRCPRLCLSLRCPRLCLSLRCPRLCLSLRCPRLCLSLRCPRLCLSLRCPRLCLSLRCPRLCLSLRCPCLCLSLRCPRLCLSEQQLSPIHPPHLLRLAIGCVDASSVLDFLSSLPPCLLSTPSSTDSLATLRATQPPPNALSISVADSWTGVHPSKQINQQGWKGQREEQKRFVEWKEEKGMISKCWRRREWRSDVERNETTGLFVSDDFGEKRWNEEYLKIHTSADSSCPDSSAFLNWSEERFRTEQEKAVVFQSLVATLKRQPALDVSMEAKAVRIIKSVSLTTRSSAQAFLTSLGQTPGESATDFVQSIGVLLSTPSQVITTATMKMLNCLFLWCSPTSRLNLVKADLIPQLIITLNPLSLSFTEAIDIHINLLEIIALSLWLSTPDGLAGLEIEAHDEQLTVHETVFTQVLSPSEKYICHLCMNHFSIIDGDQSFRFLKLLAKLLELCSNHQPTMDCVLHMPVIVTIPSCLTFFENDDSTYYFLGFMNKAQREWNEIRGEVQQMWKAADRMLRTEGIEDVIEEKLQNDQDKEGESIVSESIGWNNLLGMNLPKLWYILF
ncbi:hypothetical protein BLNAU_14580 [Blattamonas nauphoetae]|uniref:Uncharacterized protein n=1 Tax=Blattamonas nauphoetae TaxID=2049346 RepID=A0ABQ9XGJ6_9EUKA|nr:hypothetical protein BLNAU_14580 [Blattamonas nauphoetae]